MANKFFGATGLIGGSDGDLDAIPKDLLEDGHGAFVVDATTNKLYVYTLDSSNSESEDSINYTVIVPDDEAASPGKRWILVSAQPLSIGDYNYIINGDFNLWQRAASRTAVTLSQFVADRFKLIASSDAVFTVSQSSDPPTEAQSNHYSRYCLQVEVTTADAALAADQYAGINYCIEGYDYASLVGQSAILSFWVYATKTGTYTVGFRNSGTNRYYIAEYTISSSDTWELISIPITFSTTAGTWDYENGIGLEIVWSMAAGSDYHGTVGAWAVGDRFSSVNQTQSLSPVNNIFRLSQVQLTKGATAPTFLDRHIQTELALAQRYFEKSYNLDSAVGTTESNGSSRLYLDAGSEVFRIPIKFRQTKRDQPTCNVYSANAGTVDKVDRYSDDVEDGSAKNVGESGFNASNDGTLDRGIIVHWTADAELDSGL